MVITRYKRIMLLLRLMHPIYIWTSDPCTVTHQYTAHWWILLLGAANVYCCHCDTLVTLCAVCSVSVNCILSIIIPDKWFWSILPSSCFHRKLVVFVWLFLHNPGTGWCKQAAGRSTYQDKILFVFVNVFWQKSLIFSIMTSGFGLMFNICLVPRIMKMKLQTGDRQCNTVPNSSPYY